MHKAAHHAPGAGQDIEGWLVELVAGSLGLQATQLDTDTPLSCYGLDSVNAISILTAVAEKTGLQLPDYSLFEYPTISRLAEYISTQAAHAGEAAPRDRQQRLHSLMLADCVLPADIQPPAGDAATVPSAVLVTGATGFLGVHLLDVLLRKTTAQIVCLVRQSGNTTPQERLMKAMSDHGLEAGSQGSRISVVCGDLAMPQLGLSAEDLEHVAHAVDAIYHCAADVNWAQDYPGLREANVLPDVELLRLACLGRKKHFVFVSSISVCYAYRGNDEVSEATPALAQLDGIHLGYAQTKVVAEELCEQAHRRGLPVTIHRPALILGNAVTGISNQDDLVSRIIKGCIAMGCAPDLDWPVDACPVNEVAQAIFSLSQPGRRPEKISHIVHPQPRSWQELVLWMNIYGYPVDLLPYDEWARRLQAQCTSDDHALYPLRSFFLGRLPEADNLALAELYEKHRRSRVTAAGTNAVLAELSQDYSPLDSSLLERYFGAFIRRRFLPGPNNIGTAAGRDPSSVLNGHLLQTLARELYCNPGVQLASHERINTPADSSIVTDLASWKFGKPSGLFHYRFTDSEQETREVFIKLKPDDTSVLEVAATVGELSVKGLGSHFHTFSRQTGLAGCHKRELAVYRQGDSRFIRHTPRVCLLSDDDAEQRWIIGLEAIQRPVFMDSQSRAGRWTPEHVMTAIDGLASLHSIWLNREAELLQQDKLCNVLSADDMEIAQPLWYALARHADGFMSEAIGESLASVRDRLVDSVRVWWQAGESMGRTLIHNDFNPRNIAIVEKAGQPVLCAYDWELAAMGIPQRDLAELLCFVLPPDHDAREARQYIGYHRQMLGCASGYEISADDWMAGFQLALFELAVNRIPMYILVNRIRPQAFLRRITQTWHALFREFAEPGRFR